MSQQTYTRGANEDKITDIQYSAPSPTHLATPMSDVHLTPEVTYLISLRKTKSDIQP